MKPSRKERKRLADKKRNVYYTMIACEAERLTKPKPLDEQWIFKLSGFVRRLKNDNHLDAHLIQQSANEYQRFFLKVLKEGKR